MEELDRPHKTMLKISPQISIYHLWLSVWHETSALLTHISCRYLFSVNILFYKGSQQKISLKWVLMHFSKLNINGVRSNRNMINNLQCANLAKTAWRNQWDLNLDANGFFYHYAGPPMTELFQKTVLDTKCSCIRWLVTLRIDQQTICIYYLSVFFHWSVKVSHSVYIPTPLFDVINVFIWFNHISPEYVWKIFSINQPFLDPWWFVCAFLWLIIFQLLKKILTINKTLAWI